MLAIPAIDIYHGKVARLNKGDFSTAKYYERSPLEYAKQFDAIRSKWLHIVDLVASVDGKITVGSQITEIKKATRMKIEFGGGIKTFDNAELAFSFGVDRIVLGSMTISSKSVFEKIIEKYGPQKIVVATDSKDEMILIKGWTEQSAVSLWQHFDYCIELGIKYYLCTDIAKDGMLMGPNIKLYERIMKKYPKIKLIASGGVSNVADLQMLDDKQIYAAVVGKAIYENKITMQELKPFVS